MLKFKIFLLILMLIIPLVKGEENFLGRYDIRGNVAWINTEPLELTLDKDAIVVFNVEDEKCELTFSSLQKLTKSAIFSLDCSVSGKQSVIIRKDSSKEVDANYDDKLDFTLLLKKFDVTKDRITLVISKITETQKKEINPLFVIVLISSIIGLGILLYFNHKNVNSKYKKIKETLEQLENFLSLKEHENAKNAYLEVKKLYTKLTLKQQKELHKHIEELFKQFEDESKRS